MALGTVNYDFCTAKTISRLSYKPSWLSKAPSGAPRLFPLLGDVHGCSVVGQGETVVVSSNEHLAKPDPAFFQLALDKLGLPAREVLFIDDQERFRGPAEHFGMHFIAAQSPQQIVDDTKALILKENNLRLEI